MLFAWHVGQTFSPFVRQASLAAGGLQAAFFSIRDEFLGLRCMMPRDTKPEKYVANCVSGLLDGGLKGRLQARLPATQRCRAASCKRPAFSQIDELPGAM
jgi:hypothetical protein